MCGAAVDLAPALRALRHRGPDGDGTWSDGPVALGHTRLLFVVRQRLLSITRQRIEAMRATARAAPRQVDVAVIDCGKDQAALTASLATELRRKKRPTAIVASNGTVAARLLRALRALGLEIPRDVSVLAFD